MQTQACTQVYILQNTLSQNPSSFIYVLACLCLYVHVLNNYIHDVLDVITREGRVSGW